MFGRSGGGVRRSTVFTQVKIFRLRMIKISNTIIFYVWSAIINVLMSIMIKTN